MLPTLFLYHDLLLFFELIPSVEIFLFDKRWAGSSFSAGTGYLSCKTAGRDFLLGVPITLIKLIFALSNTQ